MGRAPLTLPSIERNLATVPKGPGHGRWGRPSGYISGSCRAPGLDRQAEDYDLANRHPAFAVLGPYEALPDGALQGSGEHGLTWDRSCGGKRSIVRLTVSVASKAWSVLRTRLLVSAAERAIYLGALGVPSLADQDDVRILPRN